LTNSVREYDKPSINDEHLRIELGEELLTLGYRWTVGIPWKNLNETQVQGIIKMHFERMGYRVYWAHLVDRSREEGVDLECVKGRRNVALSVKLKPKHSDRMQLHDLAKYRGKRIYVYIDNPTSSFKNEMKQVRGVSFWDCKKLDEELRSSRLGYDLAIDYSPLMQSLQDAVTLIGEIRQLASNGSTSQLKPEIDITTLWAMKDRSVAFNKISSLLVSLSEEIFDSFDPEAQFEVVSRALDFMYSTGIGPLLEEFKEERVKKSMAWTFRQTHVRSNWRALAHGIELLTDAVEGFRGPALKNYVERSSSWTPSAVFRFILSKALALEDCVDLAFREQGSAI
jgi:hypothetical protein